MSPQQPGRTLRLSNTNDLGETDSAMPTYEDEPLITPTQPNPAYAMARASDPSGTGASSEPNNLSSHKSLTMPISPDTPAIPFFWPSTSKRKRITQKIGSSSTDPDCLLADQVEENFNVSVNSNQRGKRVSAKKPYDAEDVKNPFSPSVNGFVPFYPHLGGDDFDDE
ncbi:hypothetical protein BWQ96_07750 [Gracilariopsis chorda]|uniref:Uncharacterized protein n=1 Tax=Gracilariopsis chorda TaxID=448386 RepID=A0A2V3IKG3_9FLOR|nr:hypothetical protein BWQ96_07750 [Gracilariopsis chorda]|eukprot:PXF42533.1 hypothetical protein BWQ96_07750 [Gracilariopsis chorda]